MPGGRSVPGAGSGVSGDFRAFRPARWASGPHAQTIFARTLRPTTSAVVTRERIDTPDGDFVDIDWSPDPGPGAPIVLLLHGLEGSSKRRYMTSVVGELSARGVRAAAMNFRGCSGEPNRTLRFYHSGETSDPSFILGVIRDRFPDRPLGAIGFSLGGNVLLKMMGERDDGGRALLDAAAAMSVPYDLAAGCSLLEQSTMGRVYASYFLRSLRRKVIAKADVLAGTLDVDAAVKSPTVRAFDERITAPLHGFASAAEYYARSSSASFLSDIRVPTLLIHARDDPFLPASSIPVEAARQNPDTTLVLTERGGHVGFLEGTPWAPRLWADALAAHSLAAVLSGRRRHP